MAALDIHNSSPVGRGAPTYADRAGAGYSTHIVVGTSASSIIDVSEANIIRVRNKGDSSDEGDLFLVTSTGDLVPTTGDYYPVPAGEIAYIAIDTGDTHIAFIGSVVDMDIWYSMVG